MSPLRSFTEYLERDHPNVLILTVVSLLLLNMLVGATAIYKVTEQQNQLKDNQEAVAKAAVNIATQQKQFQAQTRQFAHIQCTSSDSARKVLRDLLHFVQQRTLTNARQQGATQEEIDGLKDFYSDAINRIKITPCPKL